MYENEGELSIWRNLMEDGTKCLGEEEYHKAENCYLQGLKIAYQLTVPEIIAFTIRLLATVRVRLGKLDLAEEGFREALEICRQLRNGKGMSEAWAGLASVSAKKEMFREACQEYKQAISVYPSSSPPLRLGMLYADLGQGYMQLEESAKAQEAYTTAREICHINGFLKGEGELEALLGELSYRQGEGRKAIKSLRHACQIFTLVADILALTNALQYLALIYFDQNEMQSAFECQQRAVALCSKFEDKKAFSDSCFFLSKIGQFLEKYEEARYYLEFSIKFYSKQDLDLALRYQNLAGLFLFMLDLDKAKLYYLKALNLFQDINDEARISEVSKTLLYLEKIRNEEENPLQSYNESNTKESKLEVLVRLAETFENKRRFRDALDCYWKALEIGRKTEMITDWLETRVQRVSKRLREKNK